MDGPHASLIVKSRELGPEKQERGAHNVAQGLVVMGVGVPAAFLIRIREIKSQLAVLNGQLAADGDGNSQGFAVVVGLRSGFPGPFRPLLYLFPDCRFGALDHRLNAVIHSLFAVPIEEFDHAPFRHSRAPHKRGHFMAHHLGKTVVGQNKFGHILTPFASFHDLDYGDVEALSDAIIRQKMGSQMGAAGIGDMGSHAGPEHKLAFVEDGLDKDPVGQMDGAIRRHIGQKDIAGIDPAFKLLFCLPDRESAGDQSRRKAFGNSDGAAFGIPDPVCQIVQGHHQNVGRGSFGGLPHLAANPLNKVPRCRERNGIDRSQGVSPLS